MPADAQRLRTPFSGPQPGMVTIDLTAEVWERFRRLADERGVSRQALLGEFVLDGLRRQEDAPPSAHVSVTDVRS